MMSKIDEYRKIVETRSVGYVSHAGKRFLVDLTSANAIVTLYDAIDKETNKEKLMSLHPHAAAGVAFKLLK